MRTFAITRSCTHWWLSVTFLYFFPTLTESSDSNPIIRDPRSGSLATILNIYDEVVSTREARKLYTLDKLFGSFREKVTNSELDHAEEFSSRMSDVKKSEYTKMESEAHLPGPDSDRGRAPKLKSVSSIADVEFDFTRRPIVEQATVNSRRTEDLNLPSVKKLPPSKQKTPTLHREMEDLIGLSNPIDLIAILESDENLKTGDVRWSNIKAQRQATATFQKDSIEVDEVKVPAQEPTWRKPGPAAESCFPDLSTPKEVVEEMNRSARRCVRHANQKLEIFRETLPCSELRQLFLDSLFDDSTEKADLRDAGKRRPPRHSAYQNPLPDVEVFNSSAYVAPTRRPVLQRNDDAEVVRVFAGGLLSADENKSDESISIPKARSGSNEVSRFFDLSLAPNASRGSHAGLGKNKTEQNVLEGEENYERSRSMVRNLSLSDPDRTNFGSTENKENLNLPKISTFHSATHFSKAGVFLDSVAGRAENGRSLIPPTRNQRKDIIDSMDSKPLRFLLPAFGDVLDVQNSNEKLRTHRPTGSLPLLLPSVPSSFSVKESMKVMFQYLVKFRQLMSTCLMSSLNLLTLDSGLEVASFKALVSKMFSTPSSPDLPLLHAMVERCSGGATVVPYRLVQAVMECVQAKIDVLCMRRLQLSPDEVYSQGTAALLHSDFYSGTQAAHGDL